MLVPLPSLLLERRTAAAVVQPYKSSHDCAGGKECCRWEAFLPSCFLPIPQTKPDPAAEGSEKFKRLLLRAEYDNPQQTTLVKATLYPAVKKLDKCYPQTPFNNSWLLASWIASLYIKSFKLSLRTPKWRNTKLSASTLTLINAFINAFILSLPLLIAPAQSANITTAGIHTTGQFYSYSNNFWMAIIKMTRSLSVFLCSSWQSLFIEGETADLH